jgi:hypothetical protein
MKKTGNGTAVSIADAELLPDDRGKAWIESTLLLAFARCDLTGLYNKLDQGF